MENKYSNDNITEEVHICNTTKGMDILNPIIFIIISTIAMALLARFLN